MADGNGYATADDIAHLLGITTTLVYVWAHRDHWHRTRTRPRRYLLQDAHQSWAKRHPQPAALRSLTRRSDLHVRSGSSRSRDYVQGPSPCTEGPPNALLDMHRPRLLDTRSYVLAAAVPPAASPNRRTRLMPTLRDYQRWARKGTTAQRGYGTQHQQLRRQRIAQYRPGDRCAIGGEPLHLPAAYLDLPHDHINGGYLPGLACRRHNRAEGAARGNMLRRVGGPAVWHSARRW